jgi:hypothetical protein
VADRGHDDKRCILLERCTTVAQGRRKLERHLAGLNVGMWRSSTFVRYVTAVIFGRAEANMNRRST